MPDLVVLVPDKNTEYAVHGALNRPESLGIRAVDFRIVVDPGRDGGVRKRGTQILRLERHQFTHAVLMFDYEGSGAAMSAANLETELDATLAAHWGEAAKAIVIEPEMDIWMWGAETHIRDVVGWPAPPGIREWLVARGFVFGVHGKPERPKEAMDALFREVRVPRSSSHYGALAGRLSLARCQDAAFMRLRAALIRWFATMDN
jgi:hypothetical protein